MYPGADPEHLLGEVLRRQEEVRAEAQSEVEVRRDSRSLRGRSPVAFRLWRLHVMVWLDETPRA